MPTPDALQSGADPSELERAAALLQSPTFASDKKARLLERYPELGELWQPPAPELPHAPDTHRAEAAGAGYSQMATLGFGDELAAGLLSAFGPDLPRSAVRGSMTDTSGPNDYEAMRSGLDQQQKQVMGQHPGYAMAGGVPGAVVAGTATALGGEMLPAGAAAVLEGLGPLTKAVGAGALGGSIHGAGSAAPGQRLEGSGIPSLADDATKALTGDTEEAGQAIQSNPILAGGAAGGVLHGAGQALKPIARAMGKGANVQRVKAFHEADQVERAGAAEPILREAEAAGVTPHNANEHIRAAADELNATLAEKVRLPPAEPPPPTQRVLDLRAPKPGPPEQEAQLLVDQFFKQVGDPDVYGEGQRTMLPPPNPEAPPLQPGGGGPLRSAPVEVRKGVKAPEGGSIDMRIPTKSKRTPEMQSEIERVNAEWTDPEGEYLATPRPKTVRPGRRAKVQEEPPPVAQEALPLGPDPGKKVPLHQVQVDTAPVAASLRDDLAKIADTPANRAIRARYQREIASYEGDGMTLQQAIKQKQILDAKTYNAVGAKESVSAKEAAAIGARLRQQIDAALDAYPEMKDAFAKYNRQIELANRVKEMGRSPEAIAPNPGLLSNLGLPAHAAAAGGLRAGEKTLGGAGSALSSYPAALSAGTVPPSLRGLDEVRRDQ